MAKIRNKINIVEIYPNADKTFTVVLVHDSPRMNGQVFPTIEAANAFIAKELKR